MKKLAVAMLAAFAFTNFANAGDCGHIVFTMTFASVAEAEAACTQYAPACSVYSDSVVCDHSSHSCKLICKSH